MAWSFRSGWVTGNPVGASDLNAIAADIHTWGGNVDGGRYGLTNAGFLTLAPGDLPGNSYTVTAGSWSAGVAVLTIGAHGIKVGQHVSISSVTPTGYNSTDAAITAVTSTTISYSVLSNPGAWSSGGTVIVNGVSVAAGMMGVDSNGVLRVYNGASWAIPGDFAPPAVTVANGANQNVVFGGGGVQSIVLTGPTGAFNIGGFSGGIPGQLLQVINGQAQTLTLNHNDSGSSSGNRIFVPAQANAVLRSSGYSTATLLNSGSFWWLMSTN